MRCEEGGGGGSRVDRLRVRCEVQRRVKLDNPPLSALFLSVFQFSRFPFSFRFLEPCLASSRFGFHVYPSSLHKCRRQNGQSLLSVISFSLSFAGSFPNTLQNQGGWAPVHPITSLNTHVRPLSPWRDRFPSAPVTCTAAAPALGPLVGSRLALSEGGALPPPPAPHAGGSAAAMLRASRHF